MATRQDKVDSVLNFLIGGVCGLVIVYAVYYYWPVLMGFWEDIVDA